MTVIILILNRHRHNVNIETTGCGCYECKIVIDGPTVFVLHYRFERARSALESSSKRGSFDRISNRQEFWSIEMGHLKYDMGLRQRRKKVLLDIRHLTFEI